MNNIESSLIKTIAGSDLSSISIDAAELGLDSILDEGLLKDIPVFSTIIGLLKTGGAIKDYLYLKKIYRFLSAINDIPIQERQDLISKLGDSEKERSQAGENLLLIIDRLDNINKPEILGRMFRDFLLGTIDKSNFMWLAKSLELFNLELIANLKSYYNTELAPDDALQALATCGLVGMYFSVGGGYGGGVGGGYKKNELGKLFVEYIS